LQMNPRKTYFTHRFLAILVLTYNVFVSVVDPNSFFSDSDPQFFFGIGFGYGFGTLDKKF
jgi:hypothetical protein